MLISTTPDPTIPSATSPVVPPTTSSTTSTTPIDSRSLISQTAQPGYIQGYDTQNGYNPVYVPKGQYVPGISATSKDLTTASLNSATTYTLPNGQVGTKAQADAAMAAAQAYSDQQAAQKAADLAANPPPTAEATKMNDILNSLVGVANEGTTAVTDRATALANPDLADLSSQQGVVDQKIKENIAKSAALDSSYQAANTQAEGSNYNLSRLQGAEAQNYKMYLAQKNSLATETGLLQATSLGLQGRITDAKQTINDAFNAKVDILNAETTAWKAQADAIRPTLDKQEAAHLADVQAQKDKQIQDAKDLSTAQIQAGHDLLDAGISDSNAMLAINKAKSADEVRNVMAKFAPQLAKSGSLDLQIKQATLAKTRAETAKAIHDASTANNVSDTDVQGWVTNIKNGTAKLSDITQNPKLKTAVSTALANSGSSNIDQMLHTTVTSLGELNSMVNTNQGFSAAVGGGSLRNPVLAIKKLFGVEGTPRSGSAAADFEAKLNQVKNDVILPNLNLLHGLGRVTDREFQALTSAVTDLSTKQSKDQFKKSLTDITKQINEKVGGSNILTGPDGSTVNKDELTPAQLKEAANAGWK